MSILITGGAGYIGSHMAHALRGAGDAIDAVLAAVGYNFRLLLNWLRLLLCAILATLVAPSKLQASR